MPLNRLQFRRVALLAGLALFLTANVNSQTFSPYSDFQNMTTTQLATLQVKLTFVGLQEELIQTLAFTSPTNTVNLTKFVPFRRPGFPYTPDTRSPQTFSATVPQLQAVLQQAGLLPNITAGGVAASPYVSFALYNNVNSTDKGFETIANSADTGSLLTALRTALAGNAAGVRAVNEFGCRISVQPPGTPTDVTASVVVTLSGVRLNRATGHYTGSVTLKNNGSALSGPVSLVLTLPPAVQLFNASGYTCASAPVGLAFLDVVPAGTTFAAASAVRADLDFLNPNQVPITITSKVLSGPGGR